MVELIQADLVTDHPPDVLKVFHEGLQKIIRILLARNLPLLQQDALQYITQINRFFQQILDFSIARLDQILVQPEPIVLIRIILDPEREFYHLARKYNMDIEKVCFLFSPFF